MKCFICGEEFEKHSKMALTNCVFIALDFAKENKVLWKTHRALGKIRNEKIKKWVDQAIIRWNQKEGLI
jgi:hypothetical protein